ncbi:ExoV-like protein [Pirellula staleyi DSM 6068]|uniref:ExoV-like protein n=1 Tax=Pirellula staleyi (strain ATCC 27377 / DSM 6068 / ICPB 4128) TaxID=530564 RepID=D2QWA1_PIRSD|nr:polysaccharide pyruvyl transferase family protein [Pirellula staleyi]ADB15976.1 ExoV-like protein [Pirellula staleyi DSM 6068]
MINTYWWQGGGGSRNFGDKLGPALIEQLSGKRVCHSTIEDSDILAIGSVLEPWFWPKDSWRKYSGAIWGVGRMFGQVPFDLPAANSIAVRGLLSKSRLANSVNREVVTGDPGLLCPLLHHGLTGPARKLGVWPHWSELSHPAFKTLAASSPDITFIDPCGDIRETLDRASKCEFIASSSLHGLITADALGIPRCWLRLNTGNEDRAGMPEFKYRDYFSVYSSPPPDPLLLSSTTRLAEIVQNASSVDRNEVCLIQTTLAKCFPFGKAPTI